jgi:hypothetical protein
VKVARGFRRLFKEELLFFIFLLALFLTITALVLVMISGRSRRESLLLEYEAQRIAAALMEASRDGAELDDESLEERIVGFGIYTSRGTAGCPALRQCSPLSPAASSLQGSGSTSRSDPSS